MSVPVRLSVGKPHGNCKKQCFIVDNSGKKISIFILKIEVEFSVLKSYIKAKYGNPICSFKNFHTYIRNPLTL